MNIIKQNAGIDMSKLDFTACVCQRTSVIDDDLIISNVRKFANTKTGFNQFIKWISKISDRNIVLSFTMEATGVYHEQLANHLHKLKKKVSILLPNTVTHFAKSLNLKSKTDNIDAVTIAMMGCERKLITWEPPKLIFKKLRALSRLCRSLKGDKTRLTNRLQQLRCSFEPISEAIQMNESNIIQLDRQILELENKMVEVLKTDEQTWNKVKKLETIIGVGLKTIAVILGETNGFDLIRNQRQLASFCGYDIVRKQSGTSVNGKQRISKKGNSHIRAAMYFPAIVAIQHNPSMRKVYDRIMQNKTAKKIGQVAIQRRLLGLVYTLWKKDEEFVKNYNTDQISDDQQKEDSSTLSTRRVEQIPYETKVDELIPSPSTQNEHLHDQASEALLR